MKEFIIKRNTPMSPDLETAGLILYENWPFAETLELPWKDNQPYTGYNKGRVSCIPSGTYICKPIYWEKHEFWTWEITYVPRRTDIYIHGGFDWTYSLGCPLLGESFYNLRKHSIADNHGFREFLEIANPQIEKEIKLTILWV